MCALLTLPGIGQAGASPEIPSGWWTLREADLTTCLEVSDGRKLRLTFQARMDRNPIVIDGDYAVSATKMGDYHVTWKVSKVWQKQLSSCRKAWHDIDIASTTQLGRSIKVGDALKLTLHFECADGKPQVQLCLHDTSVVCRNLQDPNGTCKEGPAIDGSKINAPGR